MSSAVKYCIYPIGNPTLNIGKNPYIDNLIRAIDDSGHIVVNKYRFTSRGIFSLINYLFDSDEFVFNWLESLGERRFGKLQLIFLPILLILLRLFGKRIIVIFHNKHAHNSNGFFSKSGVFFSLILASAIVTHANEGKAFIYSKMGKLLKKNKVRFVNHPVYSPNLYPCDNDVIIYDFIIWGTISPYKGISDFLRYLQMDDELKKKKILICGKVTSIDFLNVLRSFDLENIKIIDEYIIDEKLMYYISISRVILFVYSGTSVLSSGALMKSLNYGKPIIGPRIGAFRDLENQKIISCYESYSDIDSLCVYNKDIRIDYLTKNSWNNLINDILK